MPVEHWCNKHHLMSARNMIKENLCVGEYFAQLLTLSWRNKVLDMIDFDIFEVKGLVNVGEVRLGFRNFF